MAYTKQTWSNNPSTATPLSAERLTYLETQYDEAVAAVPGLIAADPNFSANATAAVDAAITAEGGITDATVTALDADPASALRVQADARVAAALVAERIVQNATYAMLPKAAKNGLTGWYHVDGFGATPDAGVTDNTAAIQAAINAATPGSTVYFPGTGSGNWYKITDSLIVTTPNVRFMGQPRDAYAMSIRCPIASKTMLVIKATGFVMQDMTLYGDSSAVNGVGATVNGLDLFGDADGNIDTAVRGCTFQGLAVSIRTRGRNATLEDCLFSNSLNGITVDGKDATFHTGPNADQNRGNTIRQNRFHNIGANAATAAIEITPAAKVLHGIIESNYFDSNGGGRHMLIVGTAANMHNRLTIRGNKHTEVQTDVYTLTYVQNSTISGAEIGCVVGAGLASTAVVLTNCDSLTLSDIFAVQLGKTGIYSISSTRIRVRDCTFRASGQDTGTTGHGLDFNSGNSQCRFDRVVVDGTDGWGFLGDVSDSVMTDCEFRSCTLGNISSATLLNRATRGLNVYTEGTGGRKEDSASKAFDLTVAAGATQVATVLSGSAYTSFDVEVRVIGRNSAGALYARYMRYVRPENGAPVYVTPVADHASGTVTVSFAASGTTGVAVSVTLTGSDGFATVQVSARAGGGAATGNARGVTVTML